MGNIVSLLNDDGKELRARAGEDIFRLLRFTNHFLIHGDFRKRTMTFSCREVFAFSAFFFFLPQPAVGFCLQWRRRLKLTINATIPWHIFYCRL